MLRVPFRSESKCQPELLTFSDQDIGTICQLLLLFLPASSGLLVLVIVRNFQTSPAEEGGVSYAKVWQPRPEGSVHISVASCNASFQLFFPSVLTSY